MINLFSNYIHITYCKILLAISELSTSIPDIEYFISIYTEYLKSNELV